MTPNNQTKPPVTHESVNEQWKALRSEDSTQADLDRAIAATKELRKTTGELKVDLGDCGVPVFGERTRK